MKTETVTKTTISEDLLLHRTTSMPSWISFNLTSICTCNDNIVKCQIVGTKHRQIRAWKQHYTQTHKYSKMKN